MIKECSAPFFRNWQGSFQFHENQSTSDLYGWAKQANGYLKDSQITLNGRQLYITLDKPQWKKEQNSSLARADRAIRTLVLPNTFVFKVDWSSGQLWTVQPRELLIGGPSRTPWNSQVWKWSETNVRALGLELDRVVEKFETDF